MFTNISATGTGAIITLTEALLRAFGVEFPEGSVASAINGIAAAVGLGLIIWGQINRKDLKAGIVRKTPRKS